MDRAFALVDCNSFYCSCERIFRPDLMSRPVIVLSNNDGCTISRTNEAKALGIKMGAPYFQIKKLCQDHKVAVFSSNFSLYTNISLRVMTTLANHCPEIEVYSVDEAFADLTGIPNLLAHGKFLREIILQNIKIPTGVGIGPTKVIAKIANHLAKKSTKANGVVCLMDKKLQDIGLARVPIEDVWGIGRANSEKMKTLGIHTAKDLRDYKNERLIQKIFTKVGLQIKHELMGISCFPINVDVENKKEIMCSRTFGSSVYDLHVLKEAIASYVSNAAEKLRKQNSMCRSISVFARTNPFKNSEQFFLYEERKLVNPTCDTRKLVKYAFELLEKSFRPGFEYKKAGVKLSDFVAHNEYQLDLIEVGDTIKDFALMRAVDKINFLEGPELIKVAACGTNKKAWIMNRNFKSPRYTTSWAELCRF